MVDVAEDSDLKPAAEDSSPSSSSANPPNPAVVPPAPDEDKASDSDGDGADEILEESPDKRWSKRREKVKQRDVPGIDAAFLAMDNETGNEVVWNEVQFSERKNFRDQEEKLKSVFDNLTLLVHINLVKFHKYWTDTKSDKPRIIFITEYMSSGSMSRFLHRARSSGTPLNLKVWKKWTTQILSALNYLHSCEPPIVHANLTCNTVFIQQNGLIKIGCVAPNAIHHHVKTFRENLKTMHYVAPEFDNLTEATPESDIYSFGICALEMATTGGLCCNGASETTSQVTPDVIRKAIETLEDPKQRNFIEICLNSDPSKRPTARELLFHEALFEVHSFKLLPTLAASQSAKELSEKPYKETRSIVNMQATVEGNCLKAVLQLDDHMNRQLVTEIHQNDTATGLAADLLELGLISERDLTKMSELLGPVLESYQLSLDLSLCFPQ